ncbi:AzlD domain-containing protein [Pseudoalteromonas denitrificans]|uniref:Branched-chain amino acid transport protein n=1 Tax=Pseudoalteromonas denitrificans DSM 6059 TaxID=1123010 RepID=A0A1I1IHH5_9GAMM|nr:AzlD domain-containing protein [Pseudoalteromonas denitrificans]SFC35102.1 Branched-chain amino acid transport protein [Pseudoalteromonas denitrificans DSM 6059]
MTLITIFLLACITFLTRYLFLHPKLPLQIGPRVERFLNFSAPAVLTAIWVPIIFVKDNTLDISLTNPYLLAATLAIFVSLKTKSIYLTLAASMSIFIFLQYIS